MGDVYDSEPTCPTCGEGVYYGRCRCRSDVPTCKFCAFGLRRVGDVGGQQLYQCSNCMRVALL